LLLAEASLETLAAEIFLADELLVAVTCDKNLVQMAIQGDDLRDDVSPLLVNIIAFFSVPHFFALRQHIDDRLAELLEIQLQARDVFP